MRSFCGFVLFIFLAGCGDDRFRVAPVSGKVTLDGKPLADASVVFSPLPKETSIEVGSGSVARTDADGKYTLRVVDPDQAGAVIGKHRVIIKLPQEEAAASNSDAGARKGARYSIPLRYRDGTALEFEVLAKDQNQADFALTTP